MKGENSETKANGEAKKKLLFRWDTSHGGEIEVFDANTRRHLGVIEPLFGRQVKGPKADRKAEIDGEDSTFV